MLTADRIARAVVILYRHWLSILIVWYVDAHSLIVYSLDGISYSPYRHQRIVVIDRASRINGV